MKEFEPLQPLDEHNRKLQSHVHPTDHINPEPAEKYNMVVIGAGTAGLVAASIVAGLGGKVALVERATERRPNAGPWCLPTFRYRRSSLLDHVVFFAPAALVDVFS